MEINGGEVFLFTGGGGESGQREKVLGNEELDHLAQLEAVAGRGRVVAQLTLTQAVARAVRIQI